MNSLMAFLLIASAKAAVLVVLVLVANLLLSRWVAARWRYLLWGLVALRLVLPPCLPSETSLFNLLVWKNRCRQLCRNFRWRRRLRPFSHWLRDSTRHPLPDRPRLR